MCTSRRAYSEISVNSEADPKFKCDMALFGKEFKGDILKRKSEQQKFNENSRPGFFGDVRGTVPGKQGDARGPRLIPGASRGRTRPIFDGSMKLVIPRELNGKTQSPEVTKTTTEDRVPTSGQMPNFKDLPQNDGADQNLEIPRQNKTPRGMDEDPSQSGKRPPAHGDAVRGSGPSPGPWTAPLTGGVSGYQLGSRGKLDCGDESARGKPSSSIIRRNSKTCKLDILGERSEKWFDYTMVGTKEGLGGGGHVQNRLVTQVMTHGDIEMYAAICIYHAARKL